MTTAILDTTNDGTGRRDAEIDLILAKLFHQRRKRRRAPRMYRLLPSSPSSLFVCVEVLRPSQPNGVMSRAVSLPNHTFTGQA